MVVSPYAGGFMGVKIKAHLWTLPRWFALTLFASPAILGGLMAGGMTRYSWLGVLAAVLVMAGGHSFNSYLDYAWTGLDKGEIEDRSAEKNYSGGQSLLAKGIVSQREVLANAIGWYVLALIPVIILTTQVGWFVLVIALLGMAVTFFYARSKFNWTHELVLGIGAGPLPVLMGMYATSAAPPWADGLIVSVPFAIVTAFAGLALDEYPDAEANLKKGVKSIAYKVWESGVALEWYLSSWFLFMFVYQVFLITIGLLAPMSAIAFVLWPFLLAAMVFLRTNFEKASNAIILLGVLYPALMVLGHVLGT
jgi:1,4-dihydroxy-2-naphthoate octaprenyltransferase